MNFRRKGHAFARRIIVCIGACIAYLGCASLGFAARIPGSPPDKFYNRFETAGGVTVWTAPGSVVTSETLRREALWQQLASIPSVTSIGETGQVSIPTGEKIAIKAVRTIEAAAVVRAAAGVLAGGVAGAAATAGIMALPALIDWVSKDQQKNIRMKADNSGFEIAQDNGMPPATGLLYSMNTLGNDIWHKTPLQACNAYVATLRSQISNVTFELTTCTPELVRVHGIRTPSGQDWGYWGGWLMEREGGCPKGTWIAPNGECTTDPQHWLPASMNDIAPYLLKNQMPADLPKQVLSAGGEIEGKNESTSGPSSTAPTLPSVQTIPVDSPPNSSSSSTVPGNPYNLSGNTPTEVGKSDGSSAIQTGGQTVNVPNHTTTTATYNPNTNSTTVVNNTSHDQMRVINSTSSSTNITYNPNSATANTTTTTTTTIQNITNNTFNTVNTTVNNPPKPPDASTKPAEEKPKCEEGSKEVGCAELDTPTGEIPKKSKNITYEEVNLFGGGSCPADKEVTLSTGQVLKAWDFAQTCDYVTRWLRPVMLLMGAFAAFVILVPKSEL